MTSTQYGKCPEWVVFPYGSPRLERLLQAIRRYPLLEAAMLDVHKRRSRAIKRTVAIVARENFVWSHGDPTHPEFPLLAESFGSDSMLILVDDGAASRFAIQARYGKRHSFLGEYMDPKSDSFRLSQSRLGKVVFATRYSHEPVSYPDEILECKSVSRSPRPLSPSDEIWIAGSPIGGAAYGLLLDEVLLSPSVQDRPKFYLPHPKESRSRLRMLKAKYQFVIPRGYREFESFLQSAPKRPQQLLTFPSTVVDTAIGWGIPEDAVTVVLPGGSWLRPLEFYRALMSEFRAVYPGIQELNLTVEAP